MRQYRVIGMHNSRGKSDKKEIESKNVFRILLFDFIFARLFEPCLDFNGVHGTPHIVAYAYSHTMYSYSKCSLWFLTMIACNIFTISGWYHRQFYCHHVLLLCYGCCCCCFGAKKSNKPAIIRWKKAAYEMKLIIMGYRQLSTM